ncbi:putative flagellar-associated protein [Paratrimastix pyriformis]|uniref:Flagellar-associated protein n=1 Tax=Paratrimastix pyriformis TaxID=342808 RepID=A0ABQ8ULV6_9EUKA|nr:putative flagellar-associated protein [Paratrimastix pyriformis]
MDPQPADGESQLPPVLPEELPPPAPGGEIDGAAPAIPEEEDDGQSIIAPDHPIFERVQEALKVQLLGQRDQVELAYREKAEALARKEREHVDNGVELYRVQQDLAKKHSHLESLDARHTQVVQARSQAEAELQRVVTSVDLQKQLFAATVKKTRDAQTELDRVNETIHDVEQYHTQMQGEITLIRRAAYVADGDLVAKEREKKNQDFLIDNMQSQVKRLQEQHGLYEAQLVAQQEETKAARATLSEAATEKEPPPLAPLSAVPLCSTPLPSLHPAPILPVHFALIDAGSTTGGRVRARVQAILMEEKQLLSQYKSSVTGMQRRDEALQQSEDALRQQRENLQAMGNELHGFRTSIRQEEERVERQTELLAKVEHECQELRAAIERYRQQRDQLGQELTDLKKMADAQAQTAARALHDQHQLQQRLEHLQLAIQQTRAEQVAVEGKIREHLDEQCSYERSTSATEQSAARIRQEIHEKARSPPARHRPPKLPELQAASLQNELQRVRLDILNTQAHTSSLQKALDTLLAQLKEKDAIIERYEQEIRRKNDLITKKQSEVDKLNRRYAQLTENMKDENVGPLEACINNLRKEIDAKKADCEGLERNWMRLQVSLVAMMKQAEEEEDQIAQTKARQTVLSQRGLRLDQSCQAELAEIRDLQQGIAKMHTDMQRLNTEIAKHATKQQAIASANFTMEADFIARLKARRPSPAPAPTLELDAMRLERQIVEVKQGKEAVKNDTVEAERQMMLWERKIELERETQEALDPTKSQSDVAEMEREIHRMQLRYKSLELEQEQLLRTMEMAIKKRVAIAESAPARPLPARPMGLGWGLGSRLWADRWLVSLGHRAAAAAPKKVVTQAGLRQTNADLQRRLKAATDEAARYEGELQAASGQQQLEQQVGQMSDECKQLRDREKALQEAVTGLVMEKQKNLDKITRAQRFVKRYTAEAGGTYAPAAKPEELDQRLAAQGARKEHLDAIIQELRAQFPFIQARPRPPRPRPRPRHSSLSDVRRLMGRLGLGDGGWQIVS